MKRASHRMPFNSTEEGYLMKKLLILAMLATAGFAHAAVINFEEMAATNNGVALSGAYGATGVSFSATNAGIWGGLGNGDPGNWQVAGTNGGQFLGFNGANAGYGETVTFATGVGFVSVDFSRSNGSADETIELDAFDGATLVASTTAVLGGLNTWSTLAVSGAHITSIQWAGTGSDFHPYAVDNLQFRDAGQRVPEPASLALLGLGMAGMGLVRRARRA